MKSYNLTKGKHAWVVVLPGEPRGRDAENYGAVSYPVDMNASFLMKAIKRCRFPCVREVKYYPRWYTEIVGGHYIEITISALAEDSDLAELEELIEGSSKFEIPTTRLKKSTVFLPQLGSWGI